MNSRQRIRYPLYELALARSLPYFDASGSRQSSRMNVSSSLYSTSKSARRLPSHSSTAAVQIHAD